MDLVGGRGLPRRLHFKKFYVKTKESGPLGGRAPGNCQCRSATVQYMMVTVGLIKWDYLVYSSVCSIYTLSCCSNEGCTSAIMYVYVEAGVIPGSPLHWL